MDIARYKVAWLVIDRHAHLQRLTLADIRTIYVIHQLTSVNLGSGKE